MLSVDVKSAARATALLDGSTSTPTLSAAVRPSTLMSMYFVYPGTLESDFQPVTGMENETNVARSAHPVQFPEIQMSAPIKETHCYKL